MSLTMFPVNGSLHATPPFPPAGSRRARFPHSRQYYEGATTSHSCIRSRLLVRFRGPRDLRLFVFALALPEGSETLPGRGLLLCRLPLIRLARAWTPMGSLRSSGDPSRAFAPLHDPGRTDMTSPISSLISVLPPLDGRRRLRRFLISGLTRSFSTRCHTLHACRCRIRARLASGWPARPLPRGSRTLWIAKRGFSSCLRSSSPPALLTRPSFETLAAARSSG